MNGPMILLATGEITLGAMACAKHPVTGAALTGYLFADTFTVTAGVLMDLVDICAAGEDTICMMKFDGMIFNSLFMEIDLDGGDGTAMTVCSAAISGW